MQGRRQFSLAALATALPFAARGATNARRIGWLTAQPAASLTPLMEALRQGLADQNLVEGAGFELLFRYGDNDIGRVPELARQLVEAGVEALIVQGASVPLVAQLGLAVPMIFITSADPIAGGLAKSLAEPNGNLTGLTFMAFELHAKRLELLRAMLPRLATVTVLGNPLHAGFDLEHASTVEAGRALGIETRLAGSANAGELDRALAATARDRPGAISLLPDGFALAYRARILEFAAAERIPVISGWQVFARSGAVCSYGPRLEAVYRRVGYFVARLLSGARAASLPIERPTQFELVLNRPAATRLDIAFPRTLLARADTIIE